MYALHGQRFVPFGTGELIFRMDQKQQLLAAQRQYFLHETGMDLVPDISVAVTGFQQILRLVEIPVASRMNRL